MLDYPELKMMAIELLDKSFDGDLLENYGPGRKYNAKTKLDAIEVTDLGRVAIVGRINNAMKLAAGSNWRDVRSVDTGNCTSIGDFIKLLCRHAKVAVLVGEPK